MVNDELVGMWAQGLGFAQDHPIVREMAAEIEAYRAAAHITPKPQDAEAVGIKPLVWEAFGPNTRAYTLVVDYTIERGEKHVRLYRNVMVPMGEFDTADEAKAAAQADYAARIRSALSLPGRTE